VFLHGLVPGSIASGVTAPVSGDTVYAYVTGYVSRIAFSDGNTSLDGIKIGTSSYKVVPCGTSSGNSSTAVGSSSTASGTNSTAAGVGSQAL
jgi:hypothetical protein